MKDTREHIINVALGLFLRKSFKEVTMSDIVQATKMSKGAFYHYFESKEQIFLEILRSYFYKVMAIDYSKFSKESLYQFVRDCIADISQRIKHSEQKKNTSLKNINYFFLMFDGIKIFPEFRKKVKHIQDTELKAWKDIVHTACKKGEIKSCMTDEQIAKLFIFISDGVGLRLIVENRIDEMRSEVLKMWDGLYNQLKA